MATDNLPLLGGIVLLIGAAAIIFSTANTFLMVPSTNLTRDVFQRFIRPDASQRTVIGFQRLMIVVLALVAFVVTTQFENILDMALYAYTMVGAAVTPALLAAFLWRRVTPAGGTASVAAGMITTVVFALVARSRGGEPRPRAVPAAARLRLHHLPGGAGVAALPGGGQPADGALAGGEVAAVLGGGADRGLDDRRGRKVRCSFIRRLRGRGLALALLTPARRRPRSRRTSCDSPARSTSTTSASSPSAARTPRPTGDPTAPS